MTTPTARSLDYCRKHNLDAAIVERWNPHSRTRSDLYGFLDIVAMEPGRLGLLGIQATSQANAAARVAKILAEPRARLWLETGNRVEVWGWRQLVGRNKDGTKAKVRRWDVDRRPVTLEDFAEVATFTQAKETE